WINETGAGSRAALEAGASALLPRYIDGGTVRLQSRDLVAAEGARVEAGGGARLPARGALTTGAGGQIVLETGLCNPALPNHADAQIGNVSLGGHFDVSSFGNGGTLTLTVDRLRVGQPTRATGETALTADAFGPGGRFAGFRDLRLGAINALQVDAGP